MTSRQSVINQKEAQIQWRKLIEAGSHSLAIDLTAQQLDLLVSYIEQLLKWNRAYNLTAVHDPLDMIKLHIFDSLAIIECLAKLNANRFIDIGTGAGLPGMVLAIVCPQKIVHLLDTNGKKTRFLTHFKHLHQLNNVEIINQRCENYIPELGYDVILDIHEIKKPDLEAQLVAENVALQLERRFPFRRAMKKALQSTMSLGAQGIKIQCSGRLNGMDIARSERQRAGRVPLQTLRENIDYGFTEARTTYGLIGVKCWICKPEEE